MRVKPEAMIIFKRRSVSLPRNTSGNVALITALVVLPIMLMAGGAIDIQRFLKQKTQMQMAVDSAVIAASKLQFEGDRQLAAESFIASNLREQNVIIDDYTTTIDVIDKSRRARVNATVSAQLDTAMLGIIGIDHFNIVVSSEAEQVASFSEIALVLDISSSMTGTKIARLKPAARDFVNVFMDDGGDELTSISIVPFGGSVNIAPLFEEYVVNDTTSNTDPDAATYQAQDLATDGFRFTGADTCIEYADTDFGIDDLPENSRGQLPDFWRYAAQNPYCPEESSAILLNSSTASDLIDHINGMTLSDGTGMEIGALWGLKALSPAMRGKLGGDHDTRPANFGNRFTTKTMLIMADGGITSQDRPLDPSNPDAYDPSNLMVSLEKGDFFNPNDTTLNRFLNTCEEAKSHGVIIFTVGFEVRPSSIAEEALERCASSSAMFHRASTVSIDDVFRSIALEIGELQLTE